jgi:hypothetical protein
VAVILDESGNGLLDEASSLLNDEGVPGMGAVLTVQSFPHDGAAVAYKTSGSSPALATTANTTPCGGGLGLLIKNGSGGALTVTFTVPASITVDGMAVAAASATFTVASGADEIFPLPAVRYKDPSTGLATFALSSVSSVSTACISLS